MATLTAGGASILRRGVAGAARWLGDLERFALAQRCPGCGNESSPDALLCDGCARSIPRLGVALCVRCLAAGRDPSACAGHPGRRAFVAWAYDERAALVVRALKYEGRPALARGLGAAIAESLPAAYRPDLVVAVPLHRTRLRERGYNQAELLADSVAERLGCPGPVAALDRGRATRPQARLGPAERRANVAGAIQVSRPRALEGRTVLVVDDVITTGSTLEACLEALDRCGARAAGAALAWAS